MVASSLASSSRFRSRLTLASAVLMRLCKSTTTALTSSAEMDCDRTSPTEPRSLSAAWKCSGSTLNVRTLVPPAPPRVSCAKRKPPRPSIERIAWRVASETLVAEISSVAVKMMSRPRSGSWALTSAPAEPVVLRRDGRSSMWALSASAASKSSVSPKVDSLLAPGPAVSNAMSSVLAYATSVFSTPLLQAPASRVKSSRTAASVRRETWRSGNDRD